MKVLTLVHSLGIGGAEWMIYHLARHLRDRGTIVEIGCLGELGELGAELRAQGFEVSLYARKPGFDYTLPIRLARRIRRGGFDVVHAHQRTAVFYGLLAGLFDPTPLMYTEHGPLFGPGPSRKKKAFNRVFGRRAHRTTAVAECVKRTLVEVEGFSACGIEIVPNGVDLNRFSHSSDRRREEARTRNGLPLEAPIIGSVGRLEPVKNHGLLLHALARSAARLPGALLVLVGDGPERPRLDRLARELGVADRVRFLGLRRDVEDVLPAFDVFCLSSLNEGIPLTLLEAMAARVPVVATAVGGIPEAARSGREATLVEGAPPDCRGPLTDVGVGYVERFAGAIREVLLDSASCRALTAQAHERVTSVFSMDAVCRRYAAILEGSARRVMS